MRKSSINHKIYAYVADRNKAHIYPTNKDILDNVDGTIPSIQSTIILMVKLGSSENESDRYYKSNRLDSKKGTLKPALIKIDDGYRVADFKVIK